ncbi:MAG: hypothetical protein AB7F32_02320 [Victivallaceae bacterium]
MTQQAVFRADNAETMEVKHYACEVLRADLIGVADIGRFAGAPVMMSPSGVMPAARSVIVMAVHHPDAAIELGGIKHPQEIGPYLIQYHMNWRLDDMSYRMSSKLEKMGYQAVPIASSNIWRYRGYKGMTEQFAPDVSHMHAAVAAGLAEFGYNGLAITPEYGARQRYVTIITDAVLTPSPLLEPGSVCDNCMICKKECRSGALSKEIDGWNEVKIEDKVYRYARKNLWRCAWGEHFDLDLDLPIPEKVDEKVIMDAVIRHGRRGGEMGSCLRYCVPKALRYFDRAYTNAPRRRQHTLPNPEVEAFHRGLFEEMRSLGTVWGADQLVVSSAARLREALGIDIAAMLPGALRAVSIASVRNPLDADFSDPYCNIHQSHFAWNAVVTQSGYDMVRLLEKNGYRACLYLGFPENEFAKVLTPGDPGKDVHTLTLLTDAPLPETSWELASNAITIRDSHTLTSRIRETMAGLECDLVGIAPASLLEEIKKQLAPIYDGEEELVARNQADTIYKPFDPEITKHVRQVAGPADYLANAKSVVVLGLRMPAATVDITARTPAEAAGPYVFAQYETVMRLRILGWKLAGLLESASFKCVETLDLHRTGSFCWNPRGEYPDAFSNVFAAAAAGLADISACGSAVNERFGSNVRYIAIVTDAELEYDRPKAVDLACTACPGRCFSHCRTAAFEEPLRSINIGDHAVSFRKIDVNRCNWAKRWSLVGSEGNQYTGWHLDEAYPDKLTPEALAAAIAKVPQIEKIRPCNFEQCLLACPYSRKQ